MNESTRHEKLSEDGSAESGRELRLHLQGALHELNKLAEQIRDTKDYSEEAESLLCLKELVIEQMGIVKNEDSNHTTHATR